ncbi:MAG: TIGR04211 family SH3 domain-containing protein [Pseudomonadota bacterium]
MPLISTLLLLLAGSRGYGAEAEVVYVTDELRLGLYASEETTGRSLRTLVSGARLEILERALMSIRVRTEDGDEGWVKTAYVIEREPASRRLATVEAALAGAEAKLEQVSAENSSLSDDLAGARTALAEAEAGIERLPGLEVENAALKETLAADGPRIPFGWFLLSIALCLVAGAGLGYWWLDRRVRRQFGGLRVY